MSKLSPPLIKDAARQILCETLNRHTPSKTKYDIALLGSRRSGSTLLMQVLAQAKGIKAIDQPFSIYTASAAQMRHLPWPAGGLFIDPDDEECAALKRYMQDIREGRLHIREPWRFWSGDFHFRTDRIVLKTTDAHYLVNLLRAARFALLLYFRHPIPQALSCARNGWGDKLAHFSMHHALRTRILSDAQNELLERIARSGSTIERYVLCWCLENRPLFEEHWRGTTTIFYEDMVLDPDGTLKKLISYCEILEIPAMRAMLKKSSRSVSGLSDAEGENAIRSGNAEGIIGRWRDQIQASELRAAGNILAYFPGCPYSAEALRPTTRSPS